MRILIIACTLVHCLLLSLHATAAAETVEGGEGEGSETLPDTLEQHNGAAARIQNLLSINPGNFPLQESLNLVNELLLNKSKDQDLIYEFVRTLNRNLDKLDCETCKELVEEIRHKNHDLLNSSYSDMLHQNANLSNQLRTRLANLIADSLEISISTENHRDDFRQEYGLISQRILNSSRFRIGVGLYNTFLPTIKYNGDRHIDFSPYASDVMSENDRLLFNTEFTNKYSANIILSARIPYVEISATFPSLKIQNITVLPVQRRDLDGQDPDIDLLSRSTITSTLVFDYEVGANISIKDIAYTLLDFNEITKQVDFGLGVGAVGIEITDDIRTEIGVTTEDLTQFADFEDPDAFMSEQTKSYILPFISIFYTFEVSDEIQVSVDIKRFLHPRGRAIHEVNDLNMSIKAVWYPTFNWFEK